MNEVQNKEIHNITPKTFREDHHVFLVGKILGSTETTISSI
jgi:hypothetical protein